MEHELIFYAGKGKNLIALKNLIEQNNININKKFNDTYLLLEAINNGNDNIVRYLLKKGASKYTLDNDGNLPIHLAAMNNHFEIFKMLFEKEEDCFLKNGNELNVVELAYLNDSNEIKDFLKIKNIKLEHSRTTEIKSQFGLLKESDISFSQKLLVLFLSIFTWGGIFGIFLMAAGINSWGDSAYAIVYMFVGSIVFSLAFRKKINAMTNNQ